MLAQVTNEFLDSAMKMEVQEEGIRLLTSIVLLMSCIEEKDKYLFYLSASFSKRLLDSDIDSINCLEWEKQLVYIIKAKLGAEFSKNLEAMIADVEQCYEKKEAIREHFARHSSPSLIKAFHVNVLSNCEWTLPSLADIAPSDNTLLIQKIFEDMFAADPTNLNKRLEWNYALGSMELRFNSLDRDFAVLCKPYQYFVLQLFAPTDALTLQEIALRLKAPSCAALVPIVESLVRAAHPARSAAPARGRRRRARRAALGRDPAQSQPGLQVQVQALRPARGQARGQGRREGLGRGGPRPGDPGLHRARAQKQQGHGLPGSRQADRKADAQVRALLQGTPP
jgi:hypothetical protein